MKNTHIDSFIKNVMVQDYSNARESLTAIVNEKMKQRIIAAQKDLKENTN